MVTKVLTEHCTDFSFIIGFTTCLPGSPHNSNEQCSPAECGGHSQQVKIFNANKIGSRITVERQANGEIYFAIDSSMPIRIQFDRSSCDVNMVDENRLTPYIQMSGNVLAMSSVMTNIRKLNIDTAIAVRNAPLATATAFGPPVHKRHTKSQILPAIESGQAHQAFVAASDIDTKFIELNYPENDVKLTVNRMAVLRKNDRGERFVFYLDKMLNVDSDVTIQVTKTYNADKYSFDFEFGVTAIPSGRVKMFESAFLTDSKTIRLASHCIKINRDAKVNDKFRFTRTAAGIVEVRQNDVVRTISKMNEGAAIVRTKNLQPFVILNGRVSGIIITNGTSIEFSQTYDFPPIEFKTTKNVQLSNQTLLTWNANAKDGIIINAKPFDSILKFIIRDVRTTNNSHTMTFGVINSASIGFKTPREISTCLDFRYDNLLAPALGMKFSLYKSPNGKVTLKFDNGESNSLFSVDSSKCYYPVFILNGSVLAIELLPNPSKTTVKCSTGSTTETTTRSLPYNSSNNDCKVCMDRPIDSVFVPCGHRFACYDCGKKWMENGNEIYGSNRNCPVCRKRADSLLQTFD